VSPGVGFWPGGPPADDPAYVPPGDWPKATLALVSLVHELTQRNNQLTDQLTSELRERLRNNADAAS
jgi:hypothetical protein